MPAFTAVEPQEDWVQYALDNAPRSFKLPKRDYGRPNLLPATPPKKYDPVRRAQTDEEFAEVLRKHWGQDGTNRDLAMRRAHDWLIEAFLRADKKVTWGPNLNHAVTLRKSTDELFGWLLCVGGDATLNRGELLPACIGEVEKLYRRALIESDRAKLTLWLHLELTREIFDELLGKHSIWWHNGVWHISVDVTGPVIRRRKKRRVRTAKRRAA